MQATYAPETDLAPTPGRYKNWNERCLDQPETEADGVGSAGNHFNIK